MFSTVARYVKDATSFKTIQTCKKFKVQKNEGKGMYVKYVAEPLMSKAQSHSNGR